MTQNNLTPNPGEIWQLKTPDPNWVNGVVLAITNNGASFVAAQIVCTQLPDNYTGDNIEIHDSFATNVPVPFVVKLDNLKTLTTTHFEFKRGCLNDADWANVSNAYLNLTK